jgi:hypothetical protein
VLAAVVSGIVVVKGDSVVVIGFDVSVVDDALTQLGKFNPAQQTYLYYYSLFFSVYVI